MKLRTLSVVCALALTPMLATAGDDDDDNSVDIGQLFRGDNRVNQDDLAGMTRDEIRLAGMRMFTNPFIKPEGYGDGDDQPPSPTAGTNHEGERGTLQGNGTFQRINGLDAQTCLECHSIISRRKVPIRFGIGGVGGVNNTVLGAGGATFVDLTTTNKQQNINGRVINPPFIFGAGGIELLSNEMTEELQAQLAAAPAGATTPLSAKGVSFGSVTRDDSGNIVLNGDGTAAGVEGTFVLDPTSPDFLVVAPFGRKGDQKSTRTFDIGALSFHFGMPPNEFEVDADGNVIEDFVTDIDLDGVVNEVTQGELSALSVFVGTAQTPFQTKVRGEARRGRQIMSDIGCTECHIPKMETNTTSLGFRFPEISQQPSANVHTSVDLTEKPMSFEENGQGGVTVELFADLKRHFMGANLAEFNGDAMFTTMRLWGVADTAPYLHDGRALTIPDAIREHGLDPASEAFTAVSNFNNLSADDQSAVLAFLDTLRSPDGTFDPLQRLAKRVAKRQGISDGRGKKRDRDDD